MMCRICKDKFSIQEKVAAHDFSEQMKDFYGLSIKEPKKRRLSKKSLLSRIENELAKLQFENDEHTFYKLKQLAGEELTVQDLNEKFKLFMEEYYQNKLREEMNAS